MKQFAVIGLGNFGFHAARELYEHGNEVVAIDVDSTRVQAVDAYATKAIRVDATDMDALQALGLRSMDAVIVSTGFKISISILICLHLQEIGIKKIIAKAVDDDHAKILTRVGATQIVHPERDIAQRVARGLSQPNVIDYIPLAADYELVQIEPPPQFLGRSLKELQLRTEYNVHVIGLKNTGTDDFRLVPQADSRIETGQVLLIIGREKDIARIKSAE
jgi:trk system potassium uptake protein TrkA